MDDLGPVIVGAVIKSALVLGAVMTAAAYFVLVERWMAAWIQMRRGPNRVGIPLRVLFPFVRRDIQMFGLGQPLADGVKMLLKEELTPEHVNRRLFLLAPIVILTTSVVVFAVIPFGSVIPVNLPYVVDSLSWIPGVDRLPLADWGLDQRFYVDLIVAPAIDVGLILIFALSSVAVYGVILGGWASNNKYSFLGALRSSAQMIAYELPLGLAILGVVVASGSLRLNTIIEQQASTAVWFALAQPLGFVVFVVASFAEAARLPFDLPECEQELIGGYHTEYAGMKLVMFLTAEFIHMITAAFLIVILYLGGWHFWGLTGAGHEIGWGTALVRIAVLLLKVVGVILFFMLVRWSWPRFRFDQLMNLAWKVMLPLGIVNLVAAAVVCEFLGARSWWPAWIVIGWVVLLASWIVTAVCSPLVTDNRPRVDVEIQ